MKAILMAAALISAPAMAGTMQDGSYKGSAQWKGAEHGSGTYTVETTIADGTVSSTYSFEGQTKTWNFTAKLDANGVFDVVSDGQKVGDGYCYEVQCHYTAFNGDLEETLTFDGNHLYKLGSKTVNGSKVMWEEQLSKAAR